jgi:hypothetical protein
MKSKNHQQDIIRQLIEACDNEHDIDKRIEILYQINSILMKQHHQHLKMPSLITNAYINTALYRIEDTSISYNNSYVTDF